MRHAEQMTSLEMRHGRGPLSKMGISWDLPVLEHCIAWRNPRKLHNACSKTAQRVVVVDNGALTWKSNCKISTVGGLLTGKYRRKRMG